MQRVIITLERGALLLGLAVIALLALNFTVSHDIGATSQFRFVFSGIVLALVAVYFRVLVRPVEDLHRAAYRTALVLTVWSLVFALFPYPQSVLYLVALPALFFAYRAERKFRRRARAAGRADLAAAGALYATGVLLYFEQAPLQAVLFPGLAFDWRAYYWNAPMLVLVGVGLTRLNRWTQWRGLTLIGLAAAVIGAALSLTALVALLDGVPSEGTYLFGARGAVCTLLVLHLGILWLDGRHVSLRAFQAFAGLPAAELARLQRWFFVLALVLMHAVMLFVCTTLQGQAVAVPLLLAAVSGWLHRARNGGVAMAVAEVAVLAFLAPRLLFPGLDPLIPLAVLAALQLACLGFRRSLRFADAAPFPLFVLLAALTFVLLAGRGFFQPSSLYFVAVVGLSWSLVSPLPAPSTLLSWPVALAVVLLCANSGYDAALLGPYALALVAIPALALLASRAPPLRAWLGARRSSALQYWLGRGPAVLGLLTWPALAAVAAGALLAGPAEHYRWQALGPGLAALVVCLGVHLAEAIRHHSVRAGVAVQVFLLALLALLRWQLDGLEALDEHSPVDGYVLLGVAIVAAGLREIVRRHTSAFSRLLSVSTAAYAVVGWAYMMWLNLGVGVEAHGEVGSLLMAALYWWLSRTQGRINAIPAMVFLNVALVLYFVSAGLHNLQFYVMPVAASVLVLAQLFKDSLAAEHQKVIRLACTLLLLATSSFYNVVDFDASIAFPVVAAVVSALAVVVGIALRIRIYLFLGFGAFAFNAATVLVHVIQNQPPTQTKLIIGAIFLIIGVLFTGTFLAMQMKRQAILARYAQLREELAGWD